ncbi:hypothetical protein [Erwinia sp. 198]|uniref:hypothetical protein n=1 Tax=Erwinia sp. 198 TaxID=2022746 RepID=UPI0013158DBC|nr:hypothetical protein [Erwinia sp. 198]
MPSTDVADLIEACLDKSNGELALWIDEMPIVLQRLPGGWFFFCRATAACAC